MPTATDHLELPAPAPGTRRALRVHRYGTPGARPKAYFQAALHADEIPGCWWRSTCCAGWNRRRNKVG
ncbi:MAG: hypothetical protein R3F36_04160 [Candidatus Competibacteraceae bacterium]